MQLESKIFGLYLRNTMLAFKVLLRWDIRLLEDLSGNIKKQLLNSLEPNLKNQICIRRKPSLTLRFWVHCRPPSFLAHCIYLYGSMPFIIISCPLLLLSIYLMLPPLNY